MLLAAIDPRVKLSFPAVMVSTAMQGGCTCENASLLRVNTGNIEIAGLFAPKPQGMTTANDWTKEMATKGFPELKQLYATLGAPKNVMLHRGEHFPHNYNAVSRSAFYTWLNHHFKLGFKEPVIERDYELLTRDQLTVWDEQHPAPKADDPEFERSLLKWFTDDAEMQLHASAATFDEFHREVGGGVEVLIGRTLATVGDVEWELKVKHDRGDYVHMTGLLRNETHGEELPVAWLYPKQWNGRTVVWLGNSGKSAIADGDGTASPAVIKLVSAGATVLGADLLFQGDFLKDGQTAAKARVVANPREFAGYTFGYNHALFAQRTHDDPLHPREVSPHTAKVGAHPHPSAVDVAGFGSTGPIVAAARAIAGDAIDRAVVDTGGFRFAKLLDYRDPQFLPGGAKYLDLPGMLALGAPHSLWLAGEGSEPALISATYRAAGQINKLRCFSGEGSQNETAAVEWLLK